MITKRPIQRMGLLVMPAVSLIAEPGQELPTPHTDIVQ
jgi:hypothetical protein